MQTRSAKLVTNPASKMAFKRKTLTAAIIDIIKSSSALYAQFYHRRKKV